MGRNTRAEASHLSTSAARHSSSAGPHGYPASLLAPMAFHAGSNLCSGNARATACPNPSRPSPPDLYLQPKSQCPEPFHKATSLGTGCSHHHAAEVSTVTFEYLPLAPAARRLKLLNRWTGQCSYSIFSFKYRHALTDFLGLQRLNWSHRPHLVLEIFNKNVSSGSSTM